MSAAKKKEGFTAEEKAAMRARAKELKAAADGESAALDAMSPDDRAIGERIHAIVKECYAQHTQSTSSRRGSSTSWDCCTIEERSPSANSARMVVDPSILVTLLNPLEADCYLSRERDPTDRRRHVVTLTGAGERQLDRAAQAQRDAEDELFAGLTDTERAQLRGLLLVLRHRLTPEQNTACTSADTAEPA